MDCRQLNDGIISDLLPLLDNQDSHYAEGSTASPALDGNTSALKAFVNQENQK